MAIPCWLGLALSFAVVLIIFQVKRIWQLERENQALNAENDILETELNRRQINL